MIQLNLPVFDYKIKTDGQRTQIFDRIRRKYVALTPEEWVRQHFVNYLVKEKQYPLSLMKSESGLKYNNQRKRTDIVVFNSFGLPGLLIECKAPEIKLDKSVFEQASMYNSTLKAEHIVVTNGLDHYCCKIDFSRNSFNFLKEIPSYNFIK